GGVDPEGDLLPGAGGAEPKLLTAEPQVPRWRDHPVDLDRIGPASRLRSGSRVISWRWSGDGERVQGRGRPHAQLIIRAWKPWPEPGGRGGHVQRLVRPVLVVLLPPPVHRGLRGLDRGERPGIGEEIGLQTLVPALDLADGGGENGLVSRCLIPL